MALIKKITSEATARALPLERLHYEGDCTCRVYRDKNGKSYMELETGKPGRDKFLRRLGEGAAHVNTFLGSKPLSVKDFVMLSKEKEKKVRRQLHHMKRQGLVLQVDDAYVESPSQIFQLDEPAARQLKKLIDAFLGGRKRAGG